MGVLVAATDNIVRAGLLALVNASPELTVVGSSVDVDTLATLVEELQPDVVLLELGLHDTGTEMLPLGAIAQRASAIVVLTDEPQTEWMTETLRLGVRAVLPRSSAKAEEILAAIFATAAGLVVLHSDVVDSLLGVSPSAVRELPTTLMALTPREIEVLGMIAEGLGNKTIARRLGISEHTVKFHVSSIFTKLNAKSRTEAVTLGARQGLIML
ncbi:MAG: response regulator transcription factor [Chroococcidiopsidaceae cyanobacterium CP_BM_RX_35]|nr:response regulator transcription factor [Chroococcidiopsidaceae cyanobacterium CP_BM_RX_35]